jgi:hypothetical protein
MAIFGGSRDISLFRNINRELLWDVITQQVSFYKFKLGETLVNIYGEASGEKYYNGPVLVNCLITRANQQYADVAYGVDLNWQIDFAFLRDDLVEANLVPEVGDILLYQENYYEINSLIENQYFVGKNPDYPNEINPLNPGLGNFGYNVSVIAKTNVIPADKVGITKERM